MQMQQTVQKEVEITGKGLHSGQVINMRISPAPVDTGIVFIRTDRQNAMVKACVSSVCDTTCATTIASGDVRVGTVEHLMAAFAGLSVDNVFIEIDGPEVPIMDGSAQPFVAKILEAGITRMGKPVSYLKILKPVVVMEGPSQIAIAPYHGSRITYRLFYTHPAFGEQKKAMDITSRQFIHEIAPARTFGFLRDVEMLKSRGLVKGGSLDNAIVLNEREVINGGKLRFRDEFVRHKILDAVGDIALLGLPVFGHVMANKTGHTLHIKLLRKILMSRHALEVVSPEMPMPMSTELAAQV